jgi:phage terminase large subunit-like protein
LTLSKRLHHNGDPALRWMVSNVTCLRDHKDNIYPRKQRPEQKIDAVVAALMSLKMALTAPVQQESIVLNAGGIIL